MTLEIGMFYLVLLLNARMLLFLSIREEKRLNLLQKILLGYILSVGLIQLSGFLLGVLGLFGQKNMLIIQTVEFFILILVVIAKARKIGVLQNLDLDLNTVRQKYSSSLGEAARRMLRKEFMFLFATVSICAFYLVKYQYPIALSSYAYTYWGLELLENQSFPEFTYYWGSVREAFDNKQLLTSFIATVLTFSHGSTFQTVQVLLILVFTMTILSSYNFFRHFFPNNAAIVGCCLLASIYLSKVTSFRGECFAYPFLFVGMWLNYLGIIQEKRDYFLLGLIVTLFTVFTHGVVGSVLIIFGSSLLCTKLLLKSWNKHYDWTSFVAIVICWAVPLSLFAVSNLTRLEAGRNEEIRFHNDYIKHVLDKGIDPTFEYIRLLGPEEKDSVKYLKTGIFYSHPLKIGKTVLRKNKLRNPVILMALMISLGLVLFYERKEKYPVYLTLFFVFIAIILWAFAFSFLYSSYMPAEHVLRRETRFLRLFLGFLLCGGFAIFCHKIEPLPWAFGFRVKKSDVLVGLIAVSTIFGQAYFFGKHYNRRGVSQQAVNALVWLNDHSEKDDIVLTNYRTTRFVQIIGERKSITEGPSKYHRDMIFDAISLIHGAKRVFNDPESLLSREYLKSHNIRYVYYSAQQLSGNRITPLEYDVGKLKNAKYLKLMLETGEEEPILIFEVDHDALSSMS